LEAIFIIISSFELFFSKLLGLTFDLRVCGALSLICLTF